MADTVPQSPLGLYLVAVEELLLRLVEVDAVGGLARVRQPVALLHLAEALAAAPLLRLHVRLLQHLRIVAHTNVHMTLCPRLNFGLEA